MPQRRHRGGDQDSDSIPCALICLFLLLSTWSALAIYICLWPSIKWVLPQRPLAGIVDYSRVPGARGLELRGDRRKEISFLCKGCGYYSV